MSAFIVISLKESLNWIVDGIKDCRPHNPKVVTYLSIGKIKRQEEDKFLYEYTVFSKHDGNKSADNTLSPMIDSDIPRNLFSNQIAQFLNVCQNEGEQINIFLIDNPITDADYELSSWFVDEIRAVYESRKATNFQLVRILFSYEIDKPMDVNRQVSKIGLKQLTKINLDETDDFPTRILYIDNQNRSGAAICVDKEEHNIMIPRMLCDFMMLLSNKNDSYNVSAAISGETHIFAVGYSECMYYHDDVFRYYNLAGKRDLLYYLLKTSNNEESLDYSRYPVGLEDRLKRLKPLYAEVPFVTDISSYPESIDKKIDDIIVSFKDDITNIRQDAINKAKEIDDAATKNNIINYLHSNCLIPENISEVDLEENYRSIAEEVKVDIGGLIVTEAVEHAQKDYPKYIDRNIIYEANLVEDEEDEDFEGFCLNDNILSYKELLKFIQSKTFKEYLCAQCNKVGEKELEESTDISQVKVNEPNIFKRFFKRLFGKEKKIVKVSSKTEVHEKCKCTIRDWKSLRKSISSIKELYSERGKYVQLNDKVNEIRKEIDKLNNELHNFKLTKHCSSVDCLINLEKLEAFHQSGRELRHSKIVTQWEKRNEEERTLDAFFEVLKEQTKWDVFSFYYVNWSEPFDFIENIDLQAVCEGLKRCSQPFVNTYTLESNAENLTSYIFYTDNEQWHDDINQKRVKLRDDNKVTSIFSHHICSKICMFQFLQMNNELIKGLVDCIDN